MTLNQLLKTWRISGSTLLAELFGGLIFNGPVSGPLTTLTYGTTVTPNAGAGNLCVVTATNNTAFAVAAPTNPRAGQLLTLTIRNTSGGALGAATFNAVYKMAAWTQPGNGNSRSITFVYNGTNWVEVSRTAADVPN